VKTNNDLPLSKSSSTCSCQFKWVFVSPAASFVVFCDELAASLDRRNGPPACEAEERAVVGRAGTRWPALGAARPAAQRAGRGLLPPGPRAGLRLRCGFSADRAFSFCWVFASLLFSSPSFFQTFIQNSYGWVSFFPRDCLLPPRESIFLCYRLTLGN